ncbi:type II toxin-antitoxin system RelE/ParE family toxin [Pseudooceanicola sp.]|uniref:type II toxin-antitoxin system RelE/ParE family toxin n=1 Tax=Pseudooceanicola sp. TaxID=1914328 RepID=UPI002615604B|nr:type II toxin-antitoxin system RelE/ParE family toxin [Pseudooceanicola sp.]MDF1857063.1 type II toxin-antitoxin system RelE/ParE family toxin [Pseudooceanicola sp.]
MFDPDSYPITIAEMGPAKKELDAILSESEHDQLVDWLALNPDVGDIIQGANGVRKARWAYGSKGKRGGLRVIYYFRDLNMPIYVLAVYRKNEKLNITATEKRIISQMVDQIVEQWALRRVRNLSKSVG